MKHTLLLSSLTLATTTSIFAGEPIPVSTPVSHENCWEFSVAPYLWLAGIDGTVGVPSLPPASVDASFGDIWNNLDFAAFMAVEANKGKFKSFADFQYINLGSSATVPQLGSFKLDVEQVRIELGAGYEFYNNGSTSLTAYGAVMYNYLDNRLSGPMGNQAKASEGWVDPAIGLKINHAFTECWYGNLTGEYGGFGVSSDQTWQILAVLGYNFNERWAALGGYRHQAIDYSKNGFVYDTETSGPFLGFKYSF
ncbi:hypothetical protein [Rubritalea tangerina]|uniref:Outer membrane protein beta-barrel domain-containing protein n=1 Tax=Rubritalea tangerina TaxID=430798 RepID=A0ABW4ZF02_9BACT